MTGSASPIRFVLRNKTNWAQRLGQPPYEAYAATIGITFTFGGLKITNDAEVEDASGHPISGLYYHNYASGTGLMPGAVFYRIAGGNAAERVRGIAALGDSRHA